MLRKSLLIALLVSSLAGAPLSWAQGQFNGSGSGNANTPASNPSLTTGAINGAYHPAACSLLATAPSWCAGSDIGAWINAAYAAGTSPVVIITDPGSYSFATPIVFGGANKYVIWENQEAALTYTPSSGVPLTLSTGTTSVPNVTIYDLNLTTNVSAATTTGVSVASANYVKLINPNINGFKTILSDTSYGLEIDNPTFYNCSSAASSIGVSVSSVGDDMHIIGGGIVGCATNVSQSANENNWLDQVVLANATTDDIAITSGQMRCTQCHFVNPTGTSATYINNAGTLSLDHVYFEDDATTGTSTPIVNSGTLNVVDSNVFSAGETYTNLMSTTGFNWSGSYTTFSQYYGGTFSDAYNLTTRGDRQIVLFNPDFEVGSILPPAGWTEIGTSVVPAYETSTQYTNKTQSIKFTAGSQYAGLEYLTAFSVVPGDAYSLQAAIKGDGTSSPSAVLQFQTKTGGFVGNLSVSNSTTSWVLGTSTATVPATAAKAVLYLQNGAVSGAGTSWFDEISIQKINFPALTTSDELYGSGQTSSPSACETSYGITTAHNGSVTITTGQTCLPANSVIDAVVYRITTTLSGNAISSFTVGVVGTTSKFCSTQSTLTSGTTGICVPASYAPQTSAAAVVVTENQIATAGAIRIVVYYHTWIAPTS